MSKRRLKQHDTTSSSAINCNEILIEKLRYFRGKFLEANVVEQEFSGVLKRAHALNTLNSADGSIYSKTESGSQIPRFFNNSRGTATMSYSEKLMRFMCNNCTDSRIKANYKVLTSQAYLDILNNYTEDIDYNTVFNIGIDRLIEDLKTCDRSFYDNDMEDEIDITEGIDQLMDNISYSDSMKFKFIICMSVMLLYGGVYDSGVMDLVYRFTLASNGLDSLLMVGFMNDNEDVKSIICAYFSAYLYTNTSTMYKFDEFIFNNSAAFIYIMKEYNIKVPVHDNIEWVGTIPCRISHSSNLFSGLMAMYVKGVDVFSINKVSDACIVDGLMFVMLCNLHRIGVNRRVEFTVPGNRQIVIKNNIDMYISAAISQDMNIEHLDINKELRGYVRTSLDYKFSEYALCELSYNIIGIIPLIDIFITVNADYTIAGDITNGSLGYIVREAYSAMRVQPIQILPHIYTTYKSKDLCRKMCKLFMIADKNGIMLDPDGCRTLEECKDLLEICMMDSDSHILNALSKNYTD